jgi:hypothetical protein
MRYPGHPELRPTKRGLDQILLLIFIRELCLCAYEDVHLPNMERAFRAVLKHIGLRGKKWEFRDRYELAAMLSGKGLGASFSSAAHMRREHRAGRYNPKIRTYEDVRRQRRRRP